MPACASSFCLSREEFKRVPLQITRRAARSRACGGTMGTKIAPSAPRFSLSLYKTRDAPVARSFMHVCMHACKRDYAELTARVHVCVCRDSSRRAGEGPEGCERF